MKPIAPPRVENSEHFWTKPPPELSSRCKWWLTRIEAGWIGNKRFRIMGYYDKAWYLGVYIWEWSNVIKPALDAKREALARINP